MVLHTEPNDENILIDERESGLRDIPLDISEKDECIKLVDPDYYI